MTDAMTLHELRLAAMPDSDLQPAYLKYHIAELLKERDALVLRVDRLADLVAAVREMSRYEDRYEHCRGIDWAAYDRAVATLGALDEASR